MCAEAVMANDKINEKIRVDSEEAAQHSAARTGRGVAEGCKYTKISQKYSKHVYMYIYIYIYL